MSTPSAPNRCCKIRTQNLFVQYSIDFQRNHLHSVPVKTSIATTGTILVLQAIVKTKAHNTGRKVPTAVQAEKLCLDWKRRLLRIWTRSHQWEALALTKELQGCQAGKRLLKPMMAEGKAEAFWPNSQPELPRSRNILKAHRCLLLSSIIHLVHCRSENWHTALTKM